MLPGLTVLKYNINTLQHWTVYISFILVFVPDLSNFKTAEQNEIYLPYRNSATLQCSAHVHHYSSVLPSETLCLLMAGTRPKCLDFLQVRIKASCREYRRHKGPCWSWDKTVTPPTGFWFQGPLRSVYKLSHSLAPLWNIIDPTMEAAQYKVDKTKDRK
jgi:hypothetical protein